MGNPENLFADNPNVRRVGYIYETDDYSMFKKLEGNREVGKVTKLKKSMKKHGFMNVPAVINEFNEVGDGQNRVIAATELNIPVKFCVEPGIGLEETIELNNTQKKWNAWDYVNSGSINNDDYKRFKQLCEMFPYPMRVIRVAMGGSVSGAYTEKQIRDGNFKCSEYQYEEAVRTLKWLTSFDETLKKHKPHGSKRNFWQAIIFAKRLDVIDTPTLTKRIINNFKCYDNMFGSLLDCLIKTEKAYNFGTSLTNRVYIIDLYKQEISESKGKKE